jgi:glucose/arabinose dehydrogenase
MGLVAQVLFGLLAAALGVWWVMPVAPGHPLPQSNWGPNPDIPPPSQASLPTMRFPKRQVDPAWRPTAPEGFTVELFARAGLEHPRWLYELSNGDVLIAGKAVSATTTRALSHLPKRGKDRNQVVVLRGMGRVVRHGAGRTLGTFAESHFADSQRNAARAARAPAPAPRHARQGNVFLVCFVFLTRSFMGRTGICTLATRTQWCAIRFKWANCESLLRKK